MQVLLLYCLFFSFVIMNSMQKEYFHSLETQPALSLSEKVEGIIPQNDHTFVLISRLDRDKENDYQLTVWDKTSCTSLCEYVDPYYPVEVHPLTNDLIAFRGSDRRESPSGKIYIYNTKTRQKHATVLKANCFQFCKVNDTLCILTNKNTVTILKLNDLLKPQPQPLEIIEIPQQLNLDTIDNQEIQTISPYGSDGLLLASETGITLYNLITKKSSSLPIEPYSKDELPFMSHYAQNSLLVGMKHDLHLYTVTNDPIEHKCTWKGPNLPDDGYRMRLRNCLYVPQHHALISLWKSQTPTFCRFEDNPIKRTFNVPSGTVLEQGIITIHNTQNYNLDLQATIQTTEWTNSHLCRQDENILLLQTQNTIRSLNLKDLLAHYRSSKAAEKNPYSSYDEYSYML